MKKKFLVAITTYGSPAYVDLGLECYSRYPECDCIVLDDCSTDERLMAVCQNRNVPLVSNYKRHKHPMGDIQMMATAIQYAYENGYEYVVKNSRRWICLENPFPSLDSAIQISGAYTYTNTNSCWGWGFTTNFIIFKSSAWYERLPEMRHCVETRDTMELTEMYIHGLAKQTQPTTERYYTFMLSQHYPQDEQGYCHLKWMGDSWDNLPDYIMWHTKSNGWDYWDKSQQLKLDWKAEDFANIVTR